MNTVAKNTVKKVSTKKVAETVEKIKRVSEYACNVVNYNKALKNAERSLKALTVFINEIDNLPNDVKELIGVQSLNKEFKDFLIITLDKKHRFNKENYDLLSSTVRRNKDGVSTCRFYLLQGLHKLTKKETSNTTKKAVKVSAKLSA